MPRWSVLFLVLGVISLGGVPGVEAQTYPGRPIRLVTPYPPGGGTDVFARVIAQKMTESWGYSVVVDNRAGANGNIGSALVAKAAPDGYTLMINTISLVLSRSIYKSLPFDPLKDFAPITLVAAVPHVLVVNLSLPVSSVKELIVLAKAKPGRLNYASVGVGSPFQMAAELFKLTAEVNIVGIPYQGGGPAVTALIGGQVELTFANLVAALQLINAGKMRALGVTSAKRSQAAPELPTLSEAGLPGYDFSSWFGIWAPARTPKEIITKVNREVVRILRLPDVAGRLSRDGADVIANTPEEFAVYLKAESVKWGRVVKEAGIHAD